MNKGMKIINFEAENFMKIKAVQIVPDGNMVVISGKNAAGKTSILNAIMAVVDKGALKKQGVTKLLRDGAEKGKVVIDLGDIVAKLTMTEKGEYLSVENKEGMAFKSPAAVLEKLRGSVSFDPLAFSKMEGKKQREILLGLVDIGIDLDEHEAKRSEVYAARTTIGRDVATADGKLKNLESLPADLPAEEIPLATIAQERSVLDTKRILNAGQREEYAKAVDAFDKKDSETGAIEKQINDLEETLSRLRAQSAAAKQELAGLGHNAEILKGQVGALVDPDYSVLDERLTEIETTNEYVREARRRAAVFSEYEAARNEYDRLTDEIAGLDAQKNNALETANFPIDGLGVEPSGVIYGGVPLGQASDAEKLRVSVAIGMALNPQLRVLWFNHGECLDTDNWKIIEDLAGENEYQVWAEKVSEDPKVGIHIVDGEIA